MWSAESWWDRQIPTSLLQILISDGKSFWFLCTRITVQYCELLLPAAAALKVLTWYPNEGPSMTWVEHHRTAWAPWVEAVGPPTPIGRKFRGAVEETLFEDCAPSAAHDPPLVLGAAVGAITLHENCCYLGNQKTQFDTASLFLFYNHTKITQAVRINTHGFRINSFINPRIHTHTHTPWVLQLTETWVAGGAGRAVATSW